MGACLERGKQSWPKITPVATKVLYQHSDFLDKIFNSCVDLAAALPCTLLCSLPLYLGHGFSVHRVLPDASLTSDPVSLRRGAHGTACHQNSGYYNSPMHSAGQICSTPTQTHSRNLKSACHPSLSFNVPMIPAVCWSHNLAYIHLLHKTFNNTEKQTDKKGKGSASVGISGQICGLSQWKSCCKIMLISPSLRKERGLIQKKKCISLFLFFFFFFKGRWNSRQTKM